MKSILFVAIALIALFAMMISPIIAKHAAAFVAEVVAAIKAPLPHIGVNFRQAGFVALLRAYAGYPVGQVVELPKSVEDSLIANGGGVTNAGPPTPGNVSTTMPGGAVAIAIGASSVTISNPAITAQSLVWAAVAQVAADATCLRVERVVCAPGSVTIYGTANATAITIVDWAILSPYGNLTSPL